jgi:hypothetical protein
MRPISSFRDLGARPLNALSASSRLAALSGLKLCLCFDRSAAAAEMSVATGGAILYFRLGSLPSSSTSTTIHTPTAPL